MATSVASVAQHAGVVFAEHRGVACGILMSFWLDWVYDIPMVELSITVFVVRSSSGPVCGWLAMNHLMSPNLIPGKATAVHVDKKK